MKRRRSISCKHSEKTFVEDQIDFEEALETEFQEVYEDVEETPQDNQPVSELLPGPKGQPLYYDGIGYYYNETSEEDSFRLLHCSHSGCGAQAQMDLIPGAPITLLPTSEGHAHQPNIARRERIRFLHRIKTRHNFGDAPFHIIFQEEAKVNPLGASFFSFEKIEKHLKKKASQTEGTSQTTPYKGPSPLIETRRSAMNTRSKRLSDPPIAKKRKLDVLNKSENLPNKLELLKTTFTEPSDSRSDESSPSVSGPSQPEQSKEQSERVPALLSNSWLYHDCNGYYYTSKGISQDKRFLQCAVPECKVRGWMSLEPQAPIHTLQAHSHDRQPHQHRTELWFYHKIKAKVLERWNESVAQVYSHVAAKDPEGAALISEEDAQNLVKKLCPERGRMPGNMVHQPGKLPSERLPGPVFCNISQYHDGKGFYYYKDKKVQNSNMWYLRCVCATCPGKAIMACKEGAPITVKYRHSHGPDFLHHQICLFTHALKKRTRDENTPLKIIYSEEANKYPDAAAVIQENKVKGELLKIRRYVKYQLGISAEGDDEDNTELFSTQTPNAASEELQGALKPVYHDGRGYYFIESFSTDSFRYLMCMESQCLAQAKMLLVSGAPVVPQLGAAPHSHAPDPLRCTLLKLLDTLRLKTQSQWNKQIRDIYQEAVEKEPVVAPQISKKRLINMLENVRKSKELETSTTMLEIDNQNEEESLFVSDVPAERIPSHQLQRWLYHDGRGYYYYCCHTDTNLKRRLLKCCDCEASAWLEVKPQAVIMRAAGSVLHNHTPDTQRRDLLLILHRVATRVSCETVPYTIILEEETKRHPEVVAFIAKEKMKEILEKITVSKYFKEDIEIEEECISEEILDDIDDNEYCQSTCENLQSTSSGKPIYSDGKGFYYRDHCKTSYKQHLVCIWPLCKARAFVLQDSSMMFVPKEPAQHNHESDTFYRNKLIFVKDLRQRVLYEDTPINTIYNEEANREPIGADMVNDVSIKNFMYKLRKSKKVENIINDVDLDFLEDYEEAEYAAKTIDIPLKQLAENDTIVDLPNSNHSLDNSTEYLVDSLESDRWESQPETSQNSNKINDLKDRPVGKISGRRLGKNKPSERLPSCSSSKLFYNGEGYYYHCSAQKNDIMYLCCAEPSCKVQAWKYVDRDDSPILPSKGSPEHNHQPNFVKRNQLLFLDRCKLRAAAENIPLNDIWLMESARDPETAKQMSPENVKKQLKQYRQEQMASNSWFDPPLAQYEENDRSNCAQLPDDIHTRVIPEKVPSLINETLWHAAGFFYLPYSSTYIGSSEIIRCKCVNKRCGAQCQITTKPGGPPSIHLNLSAHNHPADHRRKDQLLFINRCKRRASESPKPIDTIYKEEAAKYSQVAKQLSASRVRQAMMIARKKANQERLITSLKDGNYEDDINDGFENISEINELKNCKEGRNKANSGIPTEHFQSEELGAMIFHDDSGYFYQDLMKSKTENKRLLKCVECEVRVTTGLEPLDKCLLPPDHAKRHTHPPGLEITLQRDNTVELQKISKANKSNSKIGPKFFRDSQVQEEIDSVQKISEFGNCSDPDYSDFVTLEEELDKPNDEEAADSESDPDFNPSHKQSVESKKQFHDGNGYYFTLVKDKRKRWLKCQTAKCPIKVQLEPREKPLLKLFKVSLSHPHPPDQLRRKRNLFLKQAAVKSTSMSISEPEKEDCGTPKSDIILPQQGKDHPAKLGKSVELVHGRRPNTFNYHDGNGFYYNTHMITESFRYLRCVKSSCKARGFMSLKPLGPIVLTRQSPGHNHRPDLAYKKYTYFLEKCKMRALEEETPIKQIYEEETALDPVSSTKISKENLIQRMTRIRNGVTGTKSMPTTQFLLDNLEEKDTINETSMEENQCDYLVKSENTVRDVLSTLDQEIEDYGGHEPENSVEPMKSETLPGYRSNSVLYHDGKGYYFIFNAMKENKRYLRCIDPKCRVKAFMDVHEGSTIYPNIGHVHNHPPDLKRRAYVLFLERCLDRALNEEDKTPQQIYREESKRDPNSASMVSEQHLLLRVKRAKRASVRFQVTDKDQTEFEEACKSQDTSSITASREMTSEDYFQVDDNDTQELGEESEASLLAQSEDTDNADTMYLYQPTESVILNRPSFCDDKGFCYQQTTLRQGVRYLKCLEKECKVRASMNVEHTNSAIVLSKQTPYHNHQPDQSEYTMLLNSGQLLGSDNTSLQLIYTDTDGGEQVAMCHIEEPANLPKRTYKQRKVPELTINTEEPVDIFDSTITEVDEAAGDYYHNEDQQQYPLKPAEVIPGLRPDANNYHDGNGFYYELNRVSHNIRYLKCLTKNCRARAYMEIGKKNAPIIQTNFAKHNHGPDLFRKKFTVFLHRMTRRAAEEDTPINVIYQEEAARDPESAGQIRMENVKQRMIRYRKKHRLSRDFNYEHFSGTEADIDGSIFRYLVEENKGVLDDSTGEYYDEDKDSNEIKTVDASKQNSCPQEENMDESSLYETFVFNEIEVESSIQQH